MSEEQPIYSINEYAPINKYIDEQARFRQTRTFWAYSKILALSLLAIGLFAILLGIAYWWFNKPHPEIVKHTVEVQPSFDSKYFNSEGEIGSNSTNQNNGDVFLDIIKQKEEIISQTQSKTVELESKIEKLENELKNPQINQEQKDRYEESLNQLQIEIKQKEDELTVYKEQLEVAEEALAKIENDTQTTVQSKPKFDDQGNPITTYQEYTVFERSEIGDNLLVITGFAWDSKTRMDEGKNFNKTWCYLDQSTPVAKFYYDDDRDQTEQIELFNITQSEIMKYQKYCSTSPSSQKVY